MIRKLAALSLLLVSACAPTEPPGSPEASPTAPSDQYAAGACTMVARAIEEQDVRFTSNSGIARRAVEAVDPGVREAGQRLALATKDAGDLFVKNDPSVDPGPTNARMAEAQRGLLTACTELFGAQPWPFAKKPSPKTTT
ncbi:hypothetical protein ACSNN7_01465 [Micromonospora sp. URMC 105]|uniref:hypothetical protein n=1 Tax=Micromonospora sp. URMC 105 TaxID=3423413 RepID=UPI003F1C8A4E